MTRRAAVTGWGKCQPQVKLTNADLEQLVDTNDEWIMARTGIRERGISHVEATDLAEVAAHRALAASGLDATDIDMVIVATMSPEIVCPSSACGLQERLGAVNAAAFDMNAACSGWVYGTATAASLITAGTVGPVLLVGAEKLHWMMDYWDRSTCVLFGDGAGAVVLEPSTSGEGVLGIDLGADGVAGRTMVIPTLGTRGSLSAVRSPYEHQFHFEGQAVFKIAVKGMEASVRRVLDRAGLTASDVDMVVPHQANARIIDAVTARLGIDPDRVAVNIKTHANTAAASIPMALTDAVDQGRIEPGAVIVQTAFGGGVTWGSTVIRWGQRVEPLGHSDLELPPCDKTVFELLRANREFYAPLHGKGGRDDGLQDDGLQDDGLRENSLRENSLQPDGGGEGIRTPGLLDATEAL